MVQCSKKTCSHKNRCYLNNNMGAVAMTLSSLLVTTRGATEAAAEAEWPRQLDLKVLKKVAELESNVTDTHQKVFRYDGYIYKAYDADLRSQQSYRNEINPTLQLVQKSCEGDEYLGAKPVIVNAHATGLDPEVYGYQSYTSQPEITGGIDLYDLYEANKNSEIDISVPAAREIMHQLVDFLEITVKHNLVHKDLHVRNMILKDGIVNVIDMDAAKSFNVEEIKKFPVFGTLFTSLSPEICALLWENPKWRETKIRNGDLNDENVLNLAFRNDLWSITTSCYTLFTGAPMEYAVMSDKDLISLNLGQRKPSPDKRIDELFKNMLALEGRPVSELKEKLVESLPRRAIKLTTSQKEFVEDLCQILSLVTHIDWTNRGSGDSKRFGVKGSMQNIFAETRKILNKQGTDRAPGRDSLRKVSEAVGEISR